MFGRLGGFQLDQGKDVYKLFVQDISCSKFQRCWFNFEV